MSASISGRIGRLRASTEEKSRQTHQTPIERFLEPCILLTLVEGPAHGYALKEHCEVQCLVEKPVEVGALYKTLRRMEREGWVTSEWADGQGPQRRVYKITELGRDVLHSWARGLAKNRKTIDNFLSRYEARFGQQAEETKSCLE